MLVWCTKRGSLSSIVDILRQKIQNANAQTILDFALARSAPDIEVSVYCQQIELRKKINSD